MNPDLSDQNILSLIQELEEEEAKQPSVGKYPPDLVQACLKITRAARERPNSVVSSYQKIQGFINKKLGCYIPTSTLSDWYGKYKAGTLELREE